MIDGSRLSFRENISATKTIVGVAARYEVPVEAELGAVLGHESGPLPPYEILYSTGKGFTDPEEAKVFAHETGIDWLSIAAGNIHGAISGAVSQHKKLEARLNIEHIRTIWNKTRIPLVLHGGTGIEPGCIQDGIKNGIVKVNIATAIRQPYMRLREISEKDACSAVYEETILQIKNVLNIENSAVVINPT
jgi:fructose/tagatose bisphosphate aldolase